MHLAEIFALPLLMETRAATLFHGTSAFSAVHIIETDTIAARTPHDPALLGLSDEGDVMGVSLTRSRPVAFTFGDIVFELDQPSLRLRTKIVPVDYWHREQVSVHKQRRTGNSEMEEFAIGPISPLSPVLVAIHIDRRYHDRLLSNVDETFTKPLLSHPKLAVSRTGLGSYPPVQTTTKP